MICLLLKYLSLLTCPNYTPFTATSTKPQNAYASADFVTKNSGEVKKNDVKAKVRPDGTFIFIWKNLVGDGTRYMVLTTNDGQHKADAQNEDDVNVNNPATWLNINSTSYTIANFEGMPALLLLSASIRK